MPLTDSAEAIVPSNGHGYVLPLVLILWYYFRQEANYMFSIILGGFWEQINYGWFFVSVAVATAIGVFAASFMGGGLEIALLAGYAGTDILESLVKLKFKEKFEKLVKI